MEDFKIILYILAAVAYFVFNAWRKAFKTNEEKENTNPGIPASPKPQGAPKPNLPKTSFEDILRELQPKLEKAQEQGKSILAKTDLPAQPAPVFSYEKAFVEARPLETVPAKTKPARGGITADEAQIHAAYQHQQSRPNRYRALLQNQRGLRDAVVLSEIFNRKY